MGAYVWPVDNWNAGDGSKYTGRRLRQLLGAVLMGKTAARPLGARSGVTAGTPASTLSISGSTVTVGPHSGVIDAQVLAIAGPYTYAFDAAVTRPVPAADASLARIDLVVVQVSDPTESDGTATPGVDVVYVTGTAGAGVPAIPARSMPLGYVNVPKNGTGSATVTWAAASTVATGGILPVTGASQYPASPYVGQYVDDPGLGGTVRWNGTVWTPVPAYATGTATTPGGTANAASSTTYLFPSGRFTTPPLVQVTANLTVTSTLNNVGVTNVTKDSCTVWCTRSTTGATLLNVFAIASAP